MVVFIGISHYNPPPMYELNGKFSIKTQPREDTSRGCLFLVKDKNKKNFVEKRGKLPLDYE